VSRVPGSVCVVGSLNFDIICRVDHLPRPGETVPSSNILRLPGGKGGNQAAAAALCGAPTIFVGAVGRDEPGQIMVDALKDAGVDVSGVVVFDQVASGHGFVTVAASGQNSIVLALGANLALTAEHVVAQAGAGHAVVMAQLECPIATVEAAFRAAPGAIKILNTAPAVLAARPLFPLADILVFNESELAAFAHAGETTDVAEVAAMAQRLLAFPEQIIVVTLGAAGAVGLKDGAVVRVEGRPAKVVDTVGAGDCFCGILAARLAQGANFEDAMTWANAGASLSVERAGAMPAMPTRGAVEAVLGVLTPDRP
jgi:ribokinase